MARTSHRKPGEDIAAALREAQACNLRADGLTFLEIAQRMGVSETTAGRLVDRGMDRVVCVDAARAKKRELRHLERVRRGLLGDRADDCAGDLDDRTATALVRVSESIRKLLGIDAPTKVDARLSEKRPQDMTLEELQQVLAEAKADGG